jgi:dUTP pyrophosphatase
MTSVDTLKSASTLVQWTRIDKDCPAYLHEPKRHGDVGWDLEASQDITIRPGEAIDVPTNVRLHLPEGVWAEIRARSSIARKGLQVDAGTIDPGYRGPLFALVRNMRTLTPVEMYNLLDLRLDVHQQRLSLGHKGVTRWVGDNAVQIMAGERIAQVVFHRVCKAWALEVEDIASDSERGVDGFGSTGH